MCRNMRQLSRKIEEYTTLAVSFLIGLVFYRRKDLASGDIRRIAVIKLDHLGDVILSIPALANLKAHFPQAHIAIVVNSSSDPIARTIAQVDEVICYDARFFDKSGGGKRFDLKNGIRFAREMRRREFDLIVDLRGSFAPLVFALTARSRYRIDRGTYLVHRKIGKIPPISQHEAEISLDLFARAGISGRPVDISLKLEETDLDSANSLLNRGDLRFPVVVIHPGAPASLKRWSAEKYAQLAGELLREYNARIVLVGRKEERQITDSIALAINHQATDLSGQTTLGQLCAVLRMADLFIGNDSGPMHIASACGTKVIGLFGPTSPQRFGPYGDKCIALRMESRCPPCMREECKTPDYRCVDKISVDNVMEIVRQMLSRDNSEFQK